MVGLLLLVSGFSPAGQIGRAHALSDGEFGPAHALRRWSEWQVVPIKMFHGIRAPVLRVGPDAGGSILLLQWVVACRVADLAASRRRLLLQLAHGGVDLAC